MSNGAATYTPPQPGSKIIIVGGGAFGLSTAYALALKNKYDVWVYDRQTIPAPDAASTDINKIVRIDYASETFYMQMAIEALPLWRQWNKERAEMGLSPVLHETGVLLFSQNGKFSDYEIQSMKAIREAGYGHLIEELGPETIVKRYPQFKDAVANGFNVAYLNRAGGWCDSAEAVKHAYYKCQQSGVRFVLGENEGCFEKFVLDPSDASKVVGIQTKDGKVHNADHVVMATGAWTPGLVDMSNKLVATGQTVVHFQLPPEMRKKFENQPVWAGDLSRTGFYGFSVNSEGKMKIGLHSRGYLNPREIDGISIPRTQVTHKTDTIPRKALREFRTFLSKFFPFTSKLDVSFARVCWYCDSIDGHFLISPHPKYQNLVVASGDSGHGMKFIPNLGFKICHVIEGIDSDYSRTWRWRDMPELATYDGLRAQSHHQQQLHLGLESDANVAMATADDFLAVKASL